MDRLALINTPHKKSAKPDSPKGEVTGRPKNLDYVKIKSTATRQIRSSSSSNNNNNNHNDEYDINDDDNNNNDDDDNINNDDDDNININNNTRKKTNSFLRYGGPGTQKVTEKFQLGWETYMASGENVIYAMIDGRGSCARGERWLHATYRNLGTLEVKDQVSGGR